MSVWPSDIEAQSIKDKVKETYHHPRLAEANVALSFNDSKPFVGDRFNWGKTSKFSSADRIWQGKQYDFHISLPADSWHSILNSTQREAWIDLHLSRCQVEYVPVMLEFNGKKKPEKDEWGRVQYTTEVKVDDEGRPKYKLEPLCLEIFAENASRYKCWIQALLDFKSVLQKV